MIGRIPDFQLYGVVGTIPDFQLGGTSSDGDRNFNPYPGTGCVCVLCVLSCVVSGGSPDILLTTDSEWPELELLSSVAYLSIVWLPYKYLTHAPLGCKSHTSYIVGG